MDLFYQQVVAQVEIEKAKFIVGKNELFPEKHR